MYALEYFRQDFTGTQDAVHVHVTAPHPFRAGQRVGSDLTLSNAALTARAEVEGRSTWDETDVCALATAELQLDNPTLGEAVQVRPAVVPEALEAPLP